MSPVWRYFNTTNQGNSLWWHWLLGIFFIFVIFIVGSLLIAIPYAELYVNLGMNIAQPSLLDYLFLCLTFMPLFFGVWLVQRFWHKRSLTQLLTYTSRFRWRHFWNAILVFLIVMAVQMTISALIWPESWQKYERNTDWNLILYGGLITLIFIPFQAASEEFLLRGYLNQALINLFKNPWLVFIATSAGFAALHMGNPEAQGQFLPYMIAIFLFGFAACILVYFEGGLESAIGWHIVNNIFVFSLFGYEDPNLPTTALFYTGPPDIGWSEVAWEVVILSAIVVGTIWLNRKTGGYDDGAENYADEMSDAFS